VALDDAKTYGVVTNNYMRAGGDGYSIFATAGKNAYDFGPDLADVTADFLAAHSPYKPYTDGRVTEVASSAAGPAPTASETTIPAAPSAPAATAPAATPAPATPDATPAPTAPAATAPATETPAALAPNTPTTHVIASGDTLWDLAKQFYGDGTLWKKISEANGKPTPRHLTVGKELQIPSK
jgi:5'-nucleotidase